MRLLKSLPNTTAKISVSCICEFHKGDRKLSIDNSYSNIDGAAFYDYYCEPCVVKYFPDKIITDVDLITD